MKITPELVDLITRKVGHFNVDVLSGWESGLLGKKRVGTFSALPHPPEHLTGKRYRDWVCGQAEGVRFRSENNKRITTFYGSGPNGPEYVRRKGWVARPSVISQMERAGVAGTVIVHYLEDGKIVRTVNCGI